MGYLQQLIFFVIFVLPFMFISPSHSSLDNVLPSNKTSDNVTLSLYYETLCPYCASFISNDLVKIFQTDLHTIVNLRLIPWGNANIVGNKIVCQHGEEECYLNTIHSCVINYWPDVKQHFEFIRCTEGQSLKEGLDENKKPMWKHCSEQLKFSDHIINKCYTTGYGYELLLQYGIETASLKPAHEYVPWVVVNDQPLEEDFGNFVKYVCDAYQGDHKPEACKNQSSIVSSTLDKIHPGCYPSENFK